jgi:arylformamidase
MPKLIDLSHTIEAGMITYKGIPAPIICDYLSREASKQLYGPDTSFHIGKIELVANTGTYLDSPFHRYADGKDLSQLPLESIAQLPGICINAQASSQLNTQLNGESKSAIDVDRFTGLDLQGKAVLIHSGWSQHWRTDQYFEQFPYLTAAAAQYLKDAGATLVGIDSYNIDSTADGQRPVHSILLGAEIPIVEHLCNLDQLGDQAFTFHAVPVKIKNFGTFPVRAYAVLD